MHMINPVRIFHARCLRILLIGCAFCCAAFSLHAQTPRLDSLYRALEDAPTDSLYGCTYRWIVLEYQQVNRDSVIPTAERLYEIGRRAGVPHLQGTAISVIHPYYSSVNLDTAAAVMRHYLARGQKENNPVVIHEALVRLIVNDLHNRDSVAHYVAMGLENAKGDSGMTGTMLVQHSKSYRALGEVALAVKLGEQALPYYTYMKDLSQIDFLVHMLTLHSSVNDTAKADAYVERLFNMDGYVGPGSEMVIHMMVARHYLDSKRPALALPHSLRGVRIADSTGRDPGSRLPLASTYKALQDWARADSVCAVARALPGFERRYRPGIVANILLVHGAVKVELGRVREGIADLEKAYAMFLSGNAGTTDGAHAELAKAYKARGDFEKAYFHLDSAAFLKEKSRNLTSIRTLAVAEQRMEAAQKEQELIARQEREALVASEKAWRAAQLRNALIAGILFVSLILFLVYRNSRHRKKVNNALSEKNRVISQSLEEKNMLLKEIHHRVKNNLQMVSNLLELQTQYTEDDAARIALAEGQNRLQSVALIHKQLYADDNRTMVNMWEYIAELVEELEFTLGMRQMDVNISSKLEHIRLDVEKAVPIGLILHEILNNAMKYAFPESRRGEVHIEFMKQGEDKLLLRIRDNGVGITEKDLANRHRSYGLRLIDLFIRELKGEVSFDGTNGTTVEMIVPLAA